MNIVSNHNRLLRGAAIPTAGGDVYNSGWEYTPEGEISGYSGSAIYTGEGCPCDSAAIVDSAFNQSTAWVDEQNYLTAHQNVTNLPYVQNSALEFSPQCLISSISGSGFYATSAEGAFIADTANYAYNAEYADSADYARSSFTAQYANSASSALNSEVANVAYTALTAHFLDEGWERDVEGFITAYNNSAFAGAGGRYEGISPIVVNNEEMRISAKSALLGVQNPLYFVEDSETATVIGIHDSAFPTFEGTPDGKISAINGSALNADPVVDYSPGNNIDITNHVISVTGSVPSADRADYAVSATSSHFSHSAIEAGSANYATESNHTHSADSATYDSLGRKIVDTYLTAHQELPDWTNTIQNASGNAYNSAVNWVVDQHYLTAVTGDNTPYTPGANIDITNHVVSGKDWTTEIQAASANAVAQIPDVTNLDYVQNSALNIANGSITSISSYNVGHPQVPVTGSGSVTISKPNGTVIIHGKEYDADITAASSYAYEQATAQIPNGVMLTSGLEYDGDNYITGYSGSAFAGQGGGIEYEGIAPIVVNNVEHKISAQSAKLGVQSPLYFVEDSVSATVIGISGLPEGQGIMYESAIGLSAGTITGYNNSAFGGGGVQSDWTETATTNLAYIKHKPLEYNLVPGQNVTLTLAGNNLTIDAIGGGSTISYTTGSI